MQKNYKVSRAKFLHSIRKLPTGTLIAMEACGTSHHWARSFQELGHRVKLIPVALFKQDKTKRVSMAAKKKMAGLDDEYRSTLLESGIKMR